MQSVCLAEEVGSMRSLLKGLMALVLVLPMIGCGGVPEKTVDRDKLDRDADRAHRDLDRQ